MASSPPMVTVITPIYNTGDFVIRAIESLRAQEYPNIEHIIIDDCSKDDSANVLEQYICNTNYRCTLIKNIQNQGLIRVLNKALSIANGEFLVLLGDDLLISDSIANQLKRFAELGPNYAVIYSDASIIDEQDETIASSYYRYKNLNPDKIPQGNIYEELLIRNYIIAPTAMIRMESIRSVGGYNPNLVSEDRDMWLKLSSRYKFGYDSTNKYAQYRIRAMSLTQTSIRNLLKSHLKLYTNYLGKNSRHDRILFNRITGTIVRLYLHYPADRMYCRNVIDDILKDKHSWELLALRHLVQLDLPNRLFANLYSRIIMPFFHISTNKSRKARLKKSYNWGLLSK